jgi:hypothetical protein
MIPLNSTQDKPAEWINLAAVEQIIYSENEEDVQVKFSSGKMTLYTGERAKMLLAQLAKCPGIS